MIKIKQFKSNLVLTVLLTSALFVTEAAVAAPITYFGENLNPGGGVSGAPVTARNNFLSALASGVGTEDFEGFSGGDTAPLNLSFPGSSGSITATLSGGGPAEICDTPGCGGSGRYATSGSNYLDTDGGASFTISFSAPISAFGFYGTDIGDIGGQVTLQLINGTTQNLVVPNSTNAPDGSLLFFGFIDSVNSYTSIVFGNTSSGDFFGFDDMTIGDLGQIIDPEVPVPATLALLGIGLIGIGRQRRKQVKAI